MRPTRFVASSLIRVNLTSARRGLASISPSKRVDAQSAESCGAMAASAAVASLVLCASPARLEPPQPSVSRFFHNESCLDVLKLGSMLHSTTCSDDFDDFYFHSDFDTEEVQFRKARRFHRAQVERYRKRWELPEDDTEPTAISWPRRLPSPEEINSLEFDFKFCHNNVNAKDQRYCDNLQFLIASYYLCRDPPTKDDDGNHGSNGTSTFSPRRGYYLLKDLADRGHADGMCLYGKVLQEGRSWGSIEGESADGMDGIEANPNDAVVWWRRAVDMHRQHHLPTLYELGVALYTGDGVPEDTQRAIRYFRKAAEQGHAGAAYMLADGLLHGVGVSQNRAEALDWLVNAGEQGHREAQRRVFAVLESALPDEEISSTDDNVNEEELGKWDLGVRNGKKNRPISIERRFTIGGGSRNPAVLARRKTVVDESRKG